MDLKTAIKNDLSIFDLLDKLKIDYPYRETCQMSCPCHEDRHASARVYADTNKIWCFVCGKVWDVIELTVDCTSMNFSQAITWLGKEFGITGAKSSVNRFYALAKDAPVVQNLSLNPQEIFIDFYKDLDKTDLVWERIFFCWDMLDKIDKTSADAVKKWLCFSLATVRDAFCVEIDLKSYLT